MPETGDDAVNLAAIASACEAWLRVWRDGKAEPSAFGAVTGSLAATLPRRAWAEPAAAAPAQGHDGLRARLAALEAERDDATGGYRVTRESVDRFRDVLADALGHADENPGDDALLAQVREHFGRTGPEPTRWRDFVTSGRAVVDQINAERRALASPAPATPETEEQS